MTEPPRCRTPILRFPITGHREYLEDLLGGRPAAPAEVDAAIARFGNLRVRRAALYSALRDRQRRPRVAGYPPTLFLSYRWSDDAIMGWVTRLADTLRDRGYRVLLDQEHLATVGPGGIGIADYVSRLVDAQVFLRVVTPPYVAGLMREWLLEEDQLAKLLAETGLRVSHVLLDDGTEPPDWGRHSVVDLRADPEDLRPLLDAVEPYRGTVLDEDAEAELPTVLAEVAGSIGRCRHREAADRLHRERRFANTFEYRQLLAHCYLGMNEPRTAADLAGSIDSLGGRPTVETLADVALLFEELGLTLAALRTAVRFVGLEGALRPRNLQLLGSLLDDAGEYFAAGNALGCSLQLARAANDQARCAAVLGLLGHVRLFGLRDPKGALPCFEESLRLAPGDESVTTNHLVCLASLGETARLAATAGELRRRPVRAGALARVLQAIESGVDVGVHVPPVRRQVTHRCTECPASFSMGPGDTLCAGCGCSSSRAAAADWSCPVCAGHRLSPLGLSDDLGVGCPVCRRGAVQRAEVRDG